ncbi:MAG TPA: hypothetical protein VGN17_08890 [Bryobacteraceae bacterium]|jgi:uncharacterized protein (TIGR03437 family)
MPWHRLIAFAVFVPALLYADVSGTVTLSSAGQLDLDTGATSSEANADLPADIEWTSGSPSIGNIIIFASSTFLAARGSVAFDSLTQATLAGYDDGTMRPGATIALAPASPRSGVGSLFAVKTKCGNYAKVIVTALNGDGSTILTLSLQFTTYTANGSSGCPAIAAIQNNYSYLLPGQPNYGIAPGSLFIVKGTVLNSFPLTPLQSSAPPGLPTDLNGTSISVTVNGITTTPAIYYTSPKQIAAVLPSQTPVGTGTIVITNAGITTAPVTIQVVQSALGLNTLDGSGTGSAVAQDANYNLFSITNSASPSQTIILWGSGVGADPSNDDTTYPLKQNNLTAIPMQVYIGGLPAAIQYRGRSQFPGVDQLVVTIPPGVPVGCAVSVAAVSGSVVSNSVTIPIAAGGGTCSDPIFSAGLPPSVTKPQGVRSGVITISQRPSGNGGLLTNAQASFTSTPGAAPSASVQRLSSLGSCLAQRLPAASTSSPNSSLDAGTVSLFTPTTPSLTFQPYLGSYVSDDFTGSPVTVSGLGGKDVGAFTTTLKLAPLTSVDLGTGSITRSQGQQIAWQGGEPGTYVAIGGGVGSLTFVCFVATSAQQFTIPSWVLLTLPAQALGNLYISNNSNPQSFTAPGLDFAYGVARNFYSGGVTFR